MTWRLSPQAGMVALEYSASFHCTAERISYMNTGKTIALTRRTLVGKVMTLLLNMLYGLVITFLPRSKHFLISWLQSPSAVILETGNQIKIQMVKEKKEVRTFTLRGLLDLRI